MVPDQLEHLKRELRSLADPQVAAGAQRYFKTGKGEYGEGDRFLGLRAAAVRSLAKKYRTLSVGDAFRLLTDSEYHEERSVALLILMEHYRKGDGSVREAIYGRYLENTCYVNGWDLVDLSAPRIVGAHLMERDPKPLMKLARSRSLWERRIAIVATLHHIRNGRFKETLGISEILLRDREDLIHKAVGWMLREVGKRDRPEEEQFLRRHYVEMPRTMLRYAIEKFPEEERQRYLKGLV